MKKTLCLILATILSLSLMTGCGSKKDTAALKAYEKSMSTVFTNFERINNDITDIDPASQTSMNELYACFDDLAAEFKHMAELKVPTDLVYYESIKALAQEGSDYMDQANEYLHQAYSETDYSENVVEAAMECYRRANKRLQYIISLIHGIDPTAKKAP